MSDQPKVESELSSRKPLLTSGVKSLLGQFMALAVVCLFFTVAESIVSDDPEFFTTKNMLKIAVQTSTIAVAAMGMTIIIIAGGIDLSAGTAIALCATVLAWFLKGDYSAFIAVPMAILTGAACGLLNGVLISWLRVVPFIVTLGTMTFYLGLAKLVADETVIRPIRYEQTPTWIVQFVSLQEKALYLGLPLGVWCALLLAILITVFLRYTVFSRYIFALGSNESTARLCGINVPRTKIILYTLSGTFVGLAGIYQFARLSVGNPNSGMGLELKVIAAVVIGGGSLNGGRGSILGTLIGATIIFLIGNGCTQLGISNPVQDMILGIIIIAAVTIDQWRQRRLVTS